MLIAETESGARIDPTPSQRAFCPQCKNPVIAKCGPLKVWHWAHEYTADCDTWGESETDWHVGWKLAFPEEQREVVIAPHRADVRTAAGWVIELQHSSIAPEEMLERELFYGSMVWVVDAEPFMANLALRVNQAGEIHFQWKWPRVSWAWAEKPLFLDMRDGTLLRIRKIDHQAPCYGWGRVVQRNEFLVRAGGSTEASALDKPIVGYCRACGRNCGLGMCSPVAPAQCPLCSSTPPANPRSGHCHFVRQCRFCRSLILTTEHPLPDEVPALRQAIAAQPCTIIRSETA